MGVAWFHHLHRINVVMNKDEFELAFRRIQDEGGHSYDSWDIAVNWLDYQENPKDHWLTKKIEEASSGS